MGYLADSPIIITINVVFDIDSDLSNMTSSFLETSKSDISFQNNSVGDSILSSGSTPPSVKNKKGVIFENDDVMSQINSDMKKFYSERKKEKEKEDH